MSFEVVTRVANEGDISDIADLTRMLWVEHSEQVPHLQDVAAIRKYDYHSYVREGMAAPNEQWLVAEAAAKVVGSARLEEEAHRSPLYAHSRLLTIDDIAVAPDARRRGVATKLLQAGIDHAAQNGISLVQAMIYEWNTPSQRLFESAGLTRTRSDYFLALG